LVIDAPKGSDRGIVLPKCLQRTTSPKVCCRKLRIHLQDSIELLDRFIVPARVVVNESDVGIDGTRQRLAVLGLPDFVKRLVGSSGRKQESRQPLMGGRIRTVESDGAPEFPFCAIPVPGVIEFDVAQ